MSFVPYTTYQSPRNLLTVSFKLFLSPLHSSTKQPYAPPSTSSFASSSRYASLPFTLPTHGPSHTIQLTPPYITGGTSGVGKQDATKVHCFSSRFMEVVCVTSEGDQHETLREIKYSCCILCFPKPLIPLICRTYSLYTHTHITSPQPRHRLIPTHHLTNLPPHPSDPTYTPSCHSSHHPIYPHTSPRL